MRTNQLVRLGDRVRVDYGRVPEPGTLVGKPPVRRAIEFTAGTSGISPTISFGVVGMTQGQQKRITFPPGKVYGQVQRKLIREIPRRRLPQHLALRIGQRLSFGRAVAGRRRLVTVIEVRPNSVVVDGNHPLAGKAVVLEITLISVDSSPNANAGKPQFEVGGES